MNEILKDEQRKYLLSPAVKPKNPSDEEKHFIRNTQGHSIAEPRKLTLRYFGGEEQPITLADLANANNHIRLPSAGISEFIPDEEPAPRDVRKQAKPDAQKSPEERTLTRFFDELAQKAGEGWYKPVANAAGQKQFMELFIPQGTVVPETVHAATQALKKLGFPATVKGHGRRLVVDMGLDEDKRQEFKELIEDSKLRAVDAVSRAKLIQFMEGVADEHRKVPITMDKSNRIATFTVPEHAQGGMEKARKAFSNFGFPTERDEDRLIIRLHADMDRMDANSLNARRLELQKLINDCWRAAKENRQHRLSEETLQHRNMSDTDPAGPILTGASAAEVVASFLRRNPHKGRISGDIIHLDLARAPTSGPGVDQAVDALNFLGVEASQTARGNIEINASSGAMREMLDRGVHRKDLVTELLKPYTAQEAMPSPK